MKRMKAVIVKEYLHLLRDSRSLLIVFFMPIFMIFIYGYAISFDLNSVQAAAVDLSQSEQSAAILKAYLHSSTFHLRVLPPSPSPVMAAEKLLQEGKIKQYLLIPRILPLPLGFKSSSTGAIPTSPTPWSNTTRGS